MGEIFALIGGALLRIGLLILTAKNSSYFVAHKVSGGSFRAIVCGNLDPFRAGSLDYRIAGGLSVDLETNSLITQGRVSDEVINGIIK